MPRASDDPRIQAVKSEILSLAGENVVEFFRDILRQGLDEVIDGGRTGRWCVEELAKTEKTYIGTKVEILLGSALDVPRGDVLDYKIAGEEVDAKMTVGTDWMIPAEAFDRICILLRADEGRRLFSVGLLRMTEDNLRLGLNQDSKNSVSAQGKRNIDWLIPPAALPLNFLASLTEAERAAVFAKRRGQARVTEFLRLATGRVIPRLAIETLGQQDDPMKRIRKNGGAQDELLPEGIVVLVGTWVKHREVAEANGIPNLGPGEVAALKTTIQRAREINLELER